MSTPPLPVLGFVLKSHNRLMSVQLLRQQAEWVIETSPVPPAEPPDPLMNSADVFAAIEARMADVRAVAAAGVAEAKAEAAVATMKADAAAAEAAVATMKADAAAAVAASLNNAVVYPLARRCLLDEARTLLQAEGGLPARVMSKAGAVPMGARDILAGKLGQVSARCQPGVTVKPSLLQADLDIIFLSSEGSPRGAVTCHVFSDEELEEAVLAASPAVEQHRNSFKRIFAYVFGRDAVERRTSS